MDNECFEIIRDDYLMKEVPKLMELIKNVD